MNRNVTGMANNSNGEATRHWMARVATSCSHSICANLPLVYVQAGIRRCLKANESVISGKSVRSVAFFIKVEYSTIWQLAS